MCYEDFRASQGVINNLKSGSKEHGELHVMLLEAAFYTENYDICRSVIERYLQAAPQLDQFYCRCKLTLGLVINEESKSLNGMESIRYHKLAVAEVVRALDVAVMPNNLSILSAAAVCCDDDKKTKEAVKYVDKAVELAEGLLSLTVTEEDKITTSNKAANTKLEEIMSAFRKIEERELLLNKPPKTQTYLKTASTLSLTHRHWMDLQHREESE